MQQVVAVEEKHVHIVHSMEDRRPGGRYNEPMREDDAEVGSRVFVTSAWLRDHLDDSGMALVDAREPYFYTQGHLPGALSLPVAHLRSAGGEPPPVQVLARKLGELGIGRDSFIMVYDGGAGTAAATLYWLLDMIGHPSASILDGGITRWRRDGLDIDYLATTLDPVNYVVVDENPDVLAVLEDVQQAIGDPDSIIIDVRAPAEYLGLQPAAMRNGHIPGAVNVDWSSSFERGEDGVAQLSPAAEVRLQFETAGVLPDKQVIVHCQSGVRSAMTYAVLKSLGFGRVRNYFASWEEWGNRPDTPIEGE
jgi:thiosulfate/3-mercaptopyruvate sulfurtransferase